MTCTCTLCLGTDRHAAIVAEVAAERERVLESRRAATRLRNLGVSLRDLGMLQAAFDHGYDAGVREEKGRVW